MCRFKSCIVLKDSIFVPDYDSHTEMLEELGIDDTEENARRLFVRMEITPNDDKPISDPMEWCAEVDQDILPDWFVFDYDIERAKRAVAEYMKAHMICYGSRTVDSGVWYVGGEAVVYAQGTAMVYAYEDSNVEAYGNQCCVNAFDRAEVRANGKTTIDADDDAVVYAEDFALVSAKGNSRVYAGEYCVVAAYEHAHVDARAEAVVRLYDNATCRGREESVVITSKWNNDYRKDVFVTQKAVVINRTDDVLATTIKKEEVEI